MSFGNISIINPLINFDWLYSNATGKGVEVAVIDSGVDAKHPDLVGKVSRGCVVKEDNDKKIFCEEIAGVDSYDVFGHGTAVSGIITRLAPEAKIINVKVLDDKNRGSGEVLIEGLRWAISNNIKIINMSLATSKEHLLMKIFELCEEAYRRNLIIVTSKRNQPFWGVDGKIGELGCPAMLSSVVNVELGDDFTEENDDKRQIRFVDQRTIKIDALGENVTVPVPNTQGYKKITGNSFATPYVAGIVALINQIFPNILPFEMMTILKHLSKR